MEKKILRVLVIDDSVDDTLLLERELCKGEWEIILKRVETREAMVQMLEKKCCGLIICDYIIPGFGGMEALKLFKSYDLDIPFIMISGKITEEIAIEALQEGAQDFISKQNYTRLLPAIRRGIERMQILTERKEATDALMESEEKYRLLFHKSIVPTSLTRAPDYRFVDVNDAWIDLFGYTREEVIGKTSLEIGLNRNKAVRLETIAKLEQGILLKDLEQVHFTKSGKMVTVLININTIIIDNESYVLASLQDITERKQAEQSLKLFRSLIDHATDAIEVIEPESFRILDVNDTECRVLGYSREELMNMSVYDIDPKFSQDVSKTAMKQLQRTGTFLFEGLHRRKNGSIFPVEINATLVELDKSYIMTMARDITDRKQYEERLHTSLLGTVRAVSDIVEMRDPYTAGHQKRVASLACAIAKELGMSEDRIEGLELAAQIHDVGKIQVPAEILSKPTQLNIVEYALIQFHPEAGYEIIKDINFPWPIAKIIRQHHEKLDGSGYPHGLKGDEILLESRILTVADIVEAMASHRPYRPALGIDAALEEIQKGRGITLDANVVDVCITLFKENRFSF